MLQPSYRDDLNWLATDRYFGEIIDGGSTWEMKAITYQDQGQLENVSMTLYAYREQSLMGKMIGKYGDSPEVQKTPQLMSDWRDVAVDVLNDSTLSTEQQLQKSNEITYDNLDPQDMAAP